MRTLFLYFILITGFTMTQTQAQANSKVILETSAGQVTIDLLPKLAPNHVSRISELVKS
ncbi:MAG: peptidylprolyl isomerase, partial [Woeseia sp.]|nr:peptidylprolyl isomerase [Woeseia sp.]